jgi:hypothetical protein
MEVTICCLIYGKMRWMLPRFRIHSYSSDETFELAACENCKAKSEEIGKSGLYQLFVNKSAEYLKSKGRKVMVWDRQWDGSG